MKEVRKITEPKHEPDARDEFASLFRMANEQLDWNQRKTAEKLAVSESVISQYLTKDPARQITPSRTTMKLLRLEISDALRKKNAPPESDGMLHDRVTDRRPDKEMDLLVRQLEDIRIFDGDGFQQVKSLVETFHRNAKRKK